jgi:hypothetical protein
MQVLTSAVRGKAAFSGTKGCVLQLCGVTALLRAKGRLQQEENERNQTHIGAAILTYPLLLDSASREHTLVNIYMSI